MSWLWYLADECCFMKIWTAICEHIKIKRAWKCTTYVMTYEPVTSWWMYVNDFDLKGYV